MAPGIHGRGLRDAPATGSESQPIPGLYAAGNAMASVMGMTYGGAGGTLGPAIVFGYLAGRHAAQAVPGEPGARS